MKYRIAIISLIFVSLFNSLPHAHAAPLRDIDTQLLDACHGRDLSKIGGLIQIGENPVDYLMAAGGHNTKPRKPGILAANSDETRIITKILQDDLAKDNGHILVNQDTISGNEASRIISGEPSISASKEARKTVNTKMPHDLLQEFRNSKEPSKIIPPLDALSGCFFARNSEISTGFKNAPMRKAQLRKFSKIVATERFSLPVFDNHHQHAIILRRGTGTAPVGFDVGHLYLLEKTDQGWRTMEQVELWSIELLYGS